MTEKHLDTCPHCGEKLKHWATPPDSTWGGENHLVCFNDACPYFQKGWQWMAEHYEVRASYRFRYDPINGSTGPLPVWSAFAMREWIVEDEGDPEEQ